MDLSKDWDGDQFARVIESHIQDSNNMHPSFFTVVYRNVTTDEATELAAHPKASAMSWSDAMAARDHAQQQLAKLEAELVHAAEVVRDAFNPVQLDISTNKEKNICQQSLLGF